MTASADLSDFLNIFRISPVKYDTIKRTWNFFIAENNISPSVDTPIILASFFHKAEEF